jgi:hypothetical protein
MPLGAPLWKASEGFYNGLTLALHGDPTEKEFARMQRLAAVFPRYEAFWRRHVCPATNRPLGIEFRTGISGLVCKIAATSYSVMVKLLDAEDSLAKVRAGDLGHRNRNWRDAIEAAGNALQLTAELQYAIAGNPKKPHLPSLAGLLRVTIDPFPDWKANWAADREMASKYRHYLVHEQLVYTVRDQGTGETLVLGRKAFAAGVNWTQAVASYAANPGDWHPLEKVCQAVLEDTVAFIDLTYERLLDKMDRLPTNPAYQGLWGWDSSTTPAAWPAPSAVPVAWPMNGVVVEPCTSSTAVNLPPVTKISSGPCLP